MNKKITAKRVEFFKDGEAAYWSVFLEYEMVLEETGKETSGLTQAGKLCYEKLRAWRKETAEKEGIPPFVIAKNSQLVEIVNKEIATLEGLKQINGFGKKRPRKMAKKSPVSLPV
ncbi:MAG: HRDC domain-containing protein [Firmicutes bacterium]|nr:HRDC domain-containing protein [Bacillota bacterium]